MEVFRNYISVNPAGPFPPGPPGADYPDDNPDDSPDNVNAATPACDETEEYDPALGELQASKDSDPEGDLAAIFEGVVERSAPGIAATVPTDPQAVKEEWQKMCKAVADFNRGHLNSQAFQVHRKFRFIGQKLLNDAHAGEGKVTAVQDGWHELRVNHDVGVCLYVEIPAVPPKRKSTWKYVWRIGNIVSMRELASEPGDKATDASLASATVLRMNPERVDLNSKTAVFGVRWYHECDANGTVLTGFQNAACKTWYKLPTSGEDYAEPVELISNKHVLEAIEMKKVMGHIGVWEATASHKKCIAKKFTEFKRAMKSK